MDALSSIFTRLSDHEAGISAVVGLTVTARSSRSTYHAEALELMQVTREWVARCLDGRCRCGLRE